MRRWNNPFRARSKALPEIDSHWPAELQIRIAQCEKDLEKAFQLLHDTYVNEGLGPEQASRMRILPQQLLPQSSIIIALWQDRIVAAVSFIRDNPLGLPVEDSISLKDERQDGKCLAEISLIALDPLDHAIHSKVIFPLFRFVFQYATRCFEVRKLFVSISPGTKSLYRDLLLFAPISRKSHALALDLEEAPQNWRDAHEGVPDEQNLGKYMASQADHSACKLPSRVYGVASDLIMTPQLLESLYLKKARLLSTLKSEEVRVLRDAYPHERFESLLKHINWSEDKAPKREMRLDAQMTARIVEAEPERTLNGPHRISVRNISRHGLQLWSSETLKMDEVLTLELRLNETQYTRVRVQVKWTETSGYFGLRILSYSSEWGQMLQSIEGQLAKLASS